MRVRYQILGHEPHAECDMTEKSARKLFEELKEKSLCEWAELVGEEDENYMDVLDSFDHISLARSVYNAMQEISMLFGKKNGE